jgi:hypothetical protein
VYLLRPVSYEPDSVPLLGQATWCPRQFKRNSAGLIWRCGHVGSGVEVRLVCVAVRVLF